MKRRDFLKTSTAAVSALSMSNLPAIAETNPPGVIPKRQYGKTDVKLSVLGFGGIIVKDTEQKDADRMVAESYERGINYYDVAPGYGNAEIILGPAMKPYRKKVFLACKTGQRKYAAAKEEFERSLDRLKTDYFDLYQLHGITDVEKDVDAAFTEDGVMKLLIEEKKKGRIRYLGFSSHSHASAAAAMDRFDFDSILFPVNFAGCMKGDFGPEIIAKAQEKGLAILALKILAHQRAGKDDPIRKQYPKCWYQPITDPELAKLAMTYTLSQPVTAAIPPGDYRLFKLAMNLVADIKPITAAQTEKLKTIASGLNPIFDNKA